MRSRTAGVGLMLVLTAGFLGAAADAPFSLSIHPRQESVPAMQDVMIDITLTNTSGRLFTMTAFSPQLVYTIEVAGPDGRPRPLTDMGQQIIRNAPQWTVQHERHFNAGRFLEVQLLPGKMFKQAIRINDIFDMFTPGIYSVRLRRKIPEALGQGEVVSNSVNVDISYNPAVEKYLPALRPK